MSNAKQTNSSNKSCRFDVIVIGAGAMGTAAAYHLSKDGKRTLLLEQYEIGHTRGSSHGGSRIIRYTHDTTAHARQMPQTFAMWRALEQETGRHLLQMTGGLYMGPPDRPFLIGARQTLDELGFPFEIHDAPALARRYPQFRIPEHWIAIDQEHTGMLAASRCVETMARRAVELGAVLREHTQVVGISPQADPDGVVVKAVGPQGKETLSAPQVVLCGGPWAPGFLQDLLPTPPSLRVTRQQVVYYPVAQADPYLPGSFPVFLCLGDEFVYGLPTWERPGTIKVSLEQETLTLDPTQPERPVEAALLAQLNQAVAEYLPGVDPTPVDIQTCLYTETTTRDFVIDRHPEHPQIILAAGFSGRGFKHSIAVGRVLADLVAAEPGTYPGEFWLDAYRLHNHLHAHLQDESQGENSPHAHDVSSHRD